MATHSSILAWRIPIDRGSWQVIVHGVAESETTERLSIHIYLHLGFPDGSVVKTPPEKQETLIRFMGQKDPLKKEMETNSTILAWKIPWIEKSGGLQSMGSQKVRHDLMTKK